MRPIGQRNLGLEEKMKDPEIEEARAKFLEDQRVSAALLRRYRDMVANGVDLGKLHELEHDLEARGVDPFVEEKPVVPEPVPERKAPPKVTVDAPTKEPVAPKRGPGRPKRETA